MFNSILNIFNKSDNDFTAKQVTTTTNTSEDRMEVDDATFVHIDVDEDYEHIDPVVDPPAADKVEVTQEVKKIVTAIYQPDPVFAEEVVVKRLIMNDMAIVGANKTPFQRPTASRKIALCLINFEGSTVTIRDIDENDQSVSVRWISGSKLHLAKDKDVFLYAYDPMNRYCRYTFDESLDIVDQRTAESGQKAKVPPAGLEMTISNNNNGGVKVEDKILFVGKKYNKWKSWETGKSGMNTYVVSQNGKTHAFFFDDGTLQIKDHNESDLITRETRFRFPRHNLVFVNDKGTFVLFRAVAYDGDDISKTIKFYIDSTKHDVSFVHSPSFCALGDEEIIVRHDRMKLKKITADNKTVDLFEVPDRQPFSHIAGFVASGDGKLILANVETLFGGSAERWYVCLIDLDKKACTVIHEYKAYVGSHKMQMMFLNC